MKKFLLGLLAALLVCSAALFAACDDGGNTGGGDGGDPNESNRGTRYSIQAPSASDNFTVTDLPDGAYEGDTVSFGITLTHPVESVINSVEIHGSATGYKELTAGLDGKYSFTMPAEPVSLSVDVDYYPDNTTDNFLSWDDGNPVSVVKWQPAYEGDQYYDSDDVLLGSTVTSQPSQSPANMALTVHEERAFSLSQSVIPDDALTVEVGERSQSNSAYQFTVHIDTSKVSAGTAKIVLVVENGHKFGDEAVLACTVTVTEPEPLDEIEIWTETVIFDLSAIIDEPTTEDLYFSFEDLDWKDTMYAQQYQTVLDGYYTVADDNTVTLTLNYAVGHRYKIELNFRPPNPDATPTIAVGESSSATYSDGELRFTAENGSITFNLS